jgi:hypothetical protein
MSKGELGLDIGPFSLAVVSEDAAFLGLFCDKLLRKHRTMRRQKPRPHRQSQANNPDDYLPDGSVEPARNSG